MKQVSFSDWKQWAKYARNDLGIAIREIAFLLIQKLEKTGSMRYTLVQRSAGWHWVL